MGYAAITTHLSRSNGSAGYIRLEQRTETIETAATPPPDSENQTTEKNAKRGRPFSWTFGALCLLSSTFDVQASRVLRSLVGAKQNCQRTYQLRSCLRREPVANGRNADLTFNRSAHHACALDDTIQPS